MDKSILQLSFIDSIELIGQLLPLKAKLDFDLRKNIISCSDHDSQIIFRFRFPLLMNFVEIPENKKLVEYKKNIPDVFIIIIQAGNAALGVYSKGKFCEHKVIRKYMVRKKQGKAQISYLKTKGKSRAGSRIRLAKTVEFFEEINWRISQWTGTYSPETVLYSCSPNLWGMLFRSKIKLPFDRKDKRLKKIPLDIGVPNYAVMTKIVRQISLGYLEISDNCPDDLLFVFNNRIGPKR